LDWCIVKPPRVRLGGVRAGDDLGAGSLISILDAFLLMTFRIFLGGGAVAIYLLLSARVLEDPTLWAFDESPADLTLRVWANTGTTGIGVSPLKSGYGSSEVVQGLQLHIKNE
jgi:hypothetical protein